MNFVNHLLNVLLNVQGLKSLNSQFRIIQHCKGSSEVNDMHYCMATTHSPNGNFKT